ncbi:MAG: hypothetical protein RLZZ383_1758 [Pseudomonadota bacterium]|jgi:hypothetical protein
MQEPRTARLALITAALSVALGVVNAWQIAGLRAEGRSTGDAGEGTAALRRSDVATAAAGSGARGLWPPGQDGPQGAAGADDVPGASTAALDLDDPTVQAGIAAVVEQEEARREEERSERFRAGVLDELSAFFEEESLDEATRQHVEAEFLRRMDAFRVMREEVRSGAISWMDARRQMDAARERSEAVLVGLLGETRAGALDERIFGAMRGGPPGR